MSAAQSQTEPASPSSELRRHGRQGLGHRLAVRAFVLLFLLTLVVGFVNFLLSFLKRFQN